MSEFGWISLHRKIKNHRFFKKKRTFSYFEAWIDLLLTATHREQKVLLANNQTVTVGRGEILTSKKALGERWGWSNNKVTKFLNDLQENHEAVSKCTSKYTLITLVNYDFYQVPPGENAYQTHIKSTSNAHQMHTYNNDNNVNNENKGRDSGHVRKGSKKSPDFRLYL